MTKLSVLDRADRAEPLVGILKYYVVGATLGLLVVVGFAYWTFGATH